MIPHLHDIYNIYFSTGIRYCNTLFTSVVICIIRDVWIFLYKSSQMPRKKQADWCQIHVPVFLKIIRLKIKLYQLWVVFIIQNKTITATLRQKVSKVLHPYWQKLGYLTTWCHYNHIHCASKNNTNVAHYNSNVYQPILVIFGRDAAEKRYYQMVICYRIFPN